MEPAKQAASETFSFIITETVLIIKGETTVQLRISAVLLRKAGRWDVPYAAIFVLNIWGLGNGLEFCLEFFGESVL